MRRKSRVWYNVFKRNPTGFRGGQSPPQAFAESLLRLLFCGQKSGRILGGQGPQVLREQNRTQNNVLKRNPTGFGGGQSPPQAFAESLLRLLFCGQKSGRILGGQGPQVLRKQNRTQNNVLKRNPTGFGGGQSPPQAFTESLLRLLYHPFPQKSRRNSEFDAKI